MASNNGTTQETTQKEEKRGTKRLASDAGIIVSQFMDHKSEEEIKNLNIDASQLVDEIKKYDSNFLLEGILMRKRRRIESVGRKIYDCIKYYGWILTVFNSEAKTKGVVPKVVSQLVMTISIGTETVTQYMIDTLLLGSDLMSTKWPLKISKSKVDDIDILILQMDIENYDIPTEILSFGRKFLGSRLLSSKQRLCFANGQIIEATNKNKKIYGFTD